MDDVGRTSLLAGGAVRDRGLGTPSVLCCVAFAMKQARRAKGGRGIGQVLGFLRNPQGFMACNLSVFSFGRVPMNTFGSLDRLQAYSVTAERRRRWLTLG